MLAVLAGQNVTFRDVQSHFVDKNIKNNLPIIKFKQLSNKAAPDFTFY